MTLFLLIFLTAYTSMHVVVLAGLAPLLPPRWIRRASLLLPAPVLAPLVVRLLEYGGYPRVAEILAWPSYIWLGVLFLAFCLFLPLLIWQLAASFLRRYHRLRLPMPGRLATAGALVIAAVAGGIALYDANVFRVETVRLDSQDPTPGREPLRIVQLSDWHLGLLTRSVDVDRVVATVQALQPDLLVITGDLIDARSERLDGYAAKLATIRPRLGKYCVTGNHEVYAGLPIAEAFARAAGCEMLRNRAVVVDGVLTLIGVDDPATGNDTQEPQLRAAADTRTLRVLLKHRPQRLDVPGVASADLQLSGHAHRGQIFPFGLVTGLRYPLQDGLSRFADGSYLYASRGTGCWGPPMRLFSPAEVTLFEIAVSGLEAQGGNRLR